PVQAVSVELAGKSIVHTRAGMLDLAVTEDRSKRQFIELPLNLGGIDGNCLDLGLDVLFLVGEKFIDLAIALDQRLAFQKRQSLFDIAALFGLVCLEPRQQEDRYVASGRLEFLDVFDKEQDFQNPNGEIIAKVLFGQLD